jgi:membrane-associated phospholipid phosphatase
MRLALASLLLFCGVCRAAAPALDADADRWLADPAGSTLVASTDTGPPRPTSRAPYPAPEGLISIGYLEVIWSDAKETATEPLRWDRDDWRTAGLIGGGLLLTGALLDKPIRDAAQRNRSTSSDRFFRDIQKFGTKQYGLPVLAGFYAYGQFADDNNAKATALDGFAANLISSLVTSTLKGAFGRARPNTGLGPGQFHSFEGDQAFPSGHATGAFTFASVIAAHYDNVWVDASAYTIASLVGVARIHLNAHWASDVVAGGLIGGLIGHHLVEFNRRLREDRSSFAPTLGTDGSELTLSWAF